MSTNFPGSPHTMGFAGFSQEPISQAFPIRWVFLPFPLLWKLKRKPMRSHIRKYTTGWESNGKKHPIYGKSMGTNFPGFPNSMGLVAFFHTMGN